MNLDKLLKKIEKNKETENEVATHPLTIGGDTYEVKTFTRSKRRDFIFERSNKDMTNVKEVINWAKPYIYNCLGLAPLATRAKEDELISNYHEVIDYLFEPEEVMDIILFMVNINKIGKKDIEDDVEEVKKQ